MQLHTIKPNTKNKKRMTVGRGGKRGKTSGRGTKGQNARSGHKKRPELRDIIKKLPKQRGRGKNIFQSFQVKPVVVNVGAFDAVFEKGTVVTPTLLKQKGLVRFLKGNKPLVKVLALGEVTKAYTVKGCAVSAGAKEKIEKAGGSVK
jgi:large subunit ribosomal protein L15